MPFLELHWILLICTSSTFIFIIIYPIDNTAEEWPANLFSALGIENLIREGPVGGLRTVFIKFEMIIF